MNSFGRASRRKLTTVLTLAFSILSGKVLALNQAELIKALTPQPQKLTVGRGNLLLRGAPMEVRVPSGPQHEACRTVLATALKATGGTFRLEKKTAADRRTEETSLPEFRVGREVELPPLPTGGRSEEGYVLRITPHGAAARGASAAGLLYAAQTFRQLIRLALPGGEVPCVSVSDYPEFRLRGIYIEGGQERFGRIVDKDYLLEQIRRLAEFKMNLLVVECYNLFPYASFPACADAGTLSREDCREIVSESKRYHVALVPSLQTLAQAYELVWANEGGAPYREMPAPGLTCPSNPDLYPFIKGLYRDLLMLFDDSPLMGIGCSEIDMQWQGRYCRKCQARVAAGETVRDLLLGHAEKCIKAVNELSVELGRPIRPLMWGDEFYMYGPGRDWVGMERIPRDVVMGFWKYWPDYAGLGGLMERGYDVLGVPAMYNHTFYLADLSPGDPPKSWPSMEQTGARNISGLTKAGAESHRLHPAQEFWGSAAASFSKHRLRAFDSIWYGFVLNGHCTWSTPQPPLEEYQEDFTPAFVRHYYDARTRSAADTLADVYNRLDRCKSQLELANQTLHDVVGVYDTQEAGYQGNTLLGACRECRKRIGAQGDPDETLARTREAAVGVVKEASGLRDLLDAQRREVGRVEELADLWLAAEKIAAHAEREVLLIDTQITLASAQTGPADLSRKNLTTEARRWKSHRKRMERILRRTSPLYSTGDPCGFASLIRDLAAIETHVSELAKVGVVMRPEGGGKVLLEERFQSLDTIRWKALGSPRVANSRLETRAPGGWGHYCGVVSREKFSLEEERPLVVEFDLTPLEMGVDSQLFASATEGGDDVSYRFAFYGPTDRFGVYTQSTTDLGNDWVDGSAGWRLRALSPTIEVSSTYHVRAMVTRRSLRIVVRPAGENALQMPFWDTGTVPMDDLQSTRMLWCDVEPEGKKGASRWGPITVWRFEHPPR